MAKLFGNRSKPFKAVDHDDMNSFDPIADGWYNAEITKSTYKENSKKTGHNANLTFNILEGKAKGRLMFVNLSLDNPSQETVQMAEKELATICRAIGVAGIEDTEDLHGKPMQIKVVGKPASNGYPAGNKISTYKRIEGLAKSSNPDKDSGDDGDEEAPKKKKAKVSFD